MSKVKDKVEDTFHESSNDGASSESPVIKKKNRASKVKRRRKYRSEPNTMNSLQISPGYFKPNGSPILVIDPFAPPSPSPTKFPNSPKISINPNMSYNANPSPPDSNITKSNPNPYLSSTPIITPIIQSAYPITNPLVYSQFPINPFISPPFTVNPQTVSIVQSNPFEAASNGMCILLF